MTVTDRGGTAPAFDLVMMDDPAWTPTKDATSRLRVFVMPDGGRWLARTAGPTVTLHGLGPATRKPTSDVFRLPPDALPEVPELAASLTDLGTVVRFRTSNLWDAIGTAILGQMLREPQAKRLYRDFCQAYGEPLDLPTGERYWLFPTPHTVLSLDAAQFDAVRLALKRVALRDAATAYLRHGARWQTLSPQTLIDELRQVPRIGRWTAHTAVVDWSNDWSLCRCGDLAARTAAKRAAPSYPWPTDERTFSNTWRTLTGSHLPVVTLLTRARAATMPTPTEPAAQAAALAHSAKGGSASRTNTDQ